MVVVPGSNPGSPRRRSQTQPSHEYFAVTQEVIMLATPCVTLLLFAYHI